MADKALEAKNKGNAAFSAKDFPTAVTHFTEAIQYDPTNHVLFSNRSASYASMGKYKEALEDANQTVQLKPDWARGYSRKGAALHGLHEYEEAIEAYEAGLKIEPNNEGLKKGREDAEKELAQAGNNMFANLLKGDIWTKLRTNPKTAAYCTQPDFIQLVNNIQQNPNLLTTSLGDPRVSAMLGVLLGIDLQTAPGDMPMSEGRPSPPPERKETKQPEKPKEPEKELPENKKQALAEKEKGTAAYKKKDFETALAHYSKAQELDSDDISYQTNKAAVYFEQGKYDEAIKECNEAIEHGRKVYADYKLIARAFARIGNCYAKQDKYAEAITAYNKSLTEHRTPDVLASLQKMEKLKKEADEKAYIDPAIALQEKEKGNEFFKKQQFPDAVKAYTEAIKRNPQDHTVYSNRAACYIKLLEYPLAIKDCDESLRINPEFVKSYIRKGNCQFFMKEYHKCLETYEKGLKIDPNNAELLEGFQKTLRMVNNQGDDEERAQKAMQDPEIQAILGDPVMMQILQDMRKDPKAAANHLKNPLVAQKIQKLVAAGIVKTA
jgi:stress-induced-phosphoprotein 1